MTRCVPLTTFWSWVSPASGVLIVYKSIWATTRIHKARDAFVVRGMSANVSCKIPVESPNTQIHAPALTPGDQSPDSQPPFRPRSGRPKGNRPREQIIAAVTAYVGGELMDDIAARFGVTQPTVSYWVNKYGQECGGAKFVRRKQGRRAEVAPDQRDMRILFKAINGSSFAAIGREHGISRARVAYIVKTWRQRSFVARPPQPLVESCSDLLSPNQTGNGSIYNETD